MPGMAGLLPFQANAREVTFVAQHAPQFPSHLCVIPPISPAPLCSPPTPGGFHRLEGFARDQLAVKGGGQHQQDIGRQVCEVVIARLVLAPTSADFSAQDGKDFR